MSAGKRAFGALLLLLGAGMSLLAGVPMVGAMATDGGWMLGLVVLGPLVFIGLAAAIGGAALALDGPGAPIRRFMGAAVMTCAVIGFALAGACAVAFGWREIQEPGSSGDYVPSLGGILAFSAGPWVSGIGLFLLGRSLRRPSRR